MKIQRRQEIRWFWLIYGIGFAGWDVYDAVRGVAGFWGWLGVAVMVLIALWAVFERTEPSPKATGTRIDFAGCDFDFAMGEVYGLRAWKLDSRGRLRALHMDSADPWRPGINVATCQAGGLDPFVVALRRSLAGGWALGGLTVSTPEEPPKHHVPVETCGCGFYAYTDLGHQENRANGRNKYVLGVVRGTGRTLIGTKGFRTEKAEIVALLDPTRGGRMLSAWRREQRRLLRTVYPGVPLLRSKRALVGYRPIERVVLTPDDDEFWSQQ